MAKLVVHFYTIDGSKYWTVVEAVSIRQANEILEKFHNGVKTSIFSYYAVDNGINEMPKDVYWISTIDGMKKVEQT